MKSQTFPQVSTMTYHVFNGTPVGQRLDDGYWEAHALCKAFGKLMHDYLRLKDKQEFFEALAADTQIPLSELIQVVKGGDPSKQGTWAHPLVMIDLAQWCDKKAHVKVTKAIYQWFATGQIPQGDIGVNYIVANMVEPVQKLRNKGMRGTIWNEHDDKGEAVQHMIDFQTAEFHRYHPDYRWPKDFVADMYQQGKITAKGITYREALRRLKRQAEAATLATMDQGRDQYGLSDEKSIEFGAGFLSGFENAQKLGVHTFEAVMAVASAAKGRHG